MLERLGDGHTFEIEEATTVRDQVQEQQQQEGSSSIPTFDRSDLSVFESPHEDRSTVLARGSGGQEGILFLVLVLVVIGVLGVLGVALFAALSAR